MITRPNRPDDGDAISAVHMAAFESADESDLVNKCSSQRRLTSSLVPRVRLRAHQPPREQPPLSSHRFAAACI
jgi:hypothetical protein